MLRWLGPINRDLELKPVQDSHELMHTLAIEHCGFYGCVMNPSGSVAQSDARPLFLCPVCLEKLHSVMDFDPQKRYEEMLLTLGPSLADDREWLTNHLRNLSAP